MSEIAVRVAKGADLLDRYQPGWAEKIDLEMLDITSVFHCVLAQVFGQYSHGINFLLDRMPEGDESRQLDWHARDFGFSLRDWEAHDIDGDMSERDDLWSAWQDEVLDRLSKD